MLNTNAEQRLLIFEISDILMRLITKKKDRGNIIYNQSS